MWLRGAVGGDADAILQEGRRNTACLALHNQHEKERNGLNLTVIMDAVATAQLRCKERVSESVMQKQIIKMVTRLRRMIGRGSRQ